MPDREGEPLLRVVLSGICGTDIQMRRGYAGFTGIPGHEFVGIVEQVGREEDRHWLGQRMVGDINIGCGTCRACREGVKFGAGQRVAVLGDGRMALLVAQVLGTTGASVSTNSTGRSPRPNTG
jgi:threonine dehydrogenase-like Zn-dependent dehydrogenase